MRPYRDLKIASLIKEELSKIILKDLEVENALVTITDILISEDLKEAKVRLSVIPLEKGPEAFIMVNEKRGELQHKLLKKMNIKPMPTLRFELENPQSAT